jgi:hypothetical protein
LQRARICQTDIFSRGANEAACDITRIGSRIEHPARPVERGIRIGTANRLMKRGNLIIKLVSTLVEAAGAARERLLRIFPIYCGYAFGCRCGFYLFE